MKKLFSLFFQRWLPIAMLIVQVWAVPAYATSLFEMPPVSEETQVVDLADVVSRFNEGRLNAALSELADRTGQEVRYVTIRRLDYDETIESFTQKLFEQWFPSTAARANQTLVVIDSQTNNTAIVTGEKVKEVMPDAIAQSISQETIQVPLRQGNRYNQAFLDATDRLTAVLSGQEDPGPPEVKDSVQTEGTFASPEETKQSNAIPWVIGLLIAATVIPMVTYYWYVR